MKKEYDFKNIKWKRNPYARKLKKQITIRLDQNVVVYFQEIAKEIEIPYQTLINLYLKDCVLSKRRLVTSWKNLLRQLSVCAQFFEEVVSYRLFVIGCYVKV